MKQDQQQQQSKIAENNKTIEEKTRCANAICWVLLTTSIRQRYKHEIPQKQAPQRAR